MDPRVNYTLVGLFVVGLGVALAVAIIWLSGGTEDKVYQTYVAYVYESVSGLNPRAPVKYRGVEVGQVREISIDKDNPERVRLVLDIEKGTPVKTDTVAILSMQGITGLAFVDLAGGSKASPDLKALPGQRYPEIKVEPSVLKRFNLALETGQTKVLEAAEEFKAVAQGLRELLEEDNRRSVANTLKHIEQLMGSLAAQASAFQENNTHVTTLLENTARLSQELPALIQRATQSVGAMDQTVKTINRTVYNFNRLITDIRQDLSRFSREGLAQAGPLLVELRQLSETLRRLGRDLQKDPDILLFGRPAVPPGPGE
jgi:phospholipid/cholesterol/gamma-HCH transport system substrate-binding protein